MVTELQWQGVNSVGEKSFDCGHCGSHVGPSIGFIGRHQSNGYQGLIMICPKCTLPTSLTIAGQIPGPQYGEIVSGITDTNVKALYDEARKCFAAHSYTGSVMVARKILMNLAVQHGAEENLNFIEYVNYLASNGWVPPNGKKWVDQIRKKGNDANHELQIMSKEDAEQVLRFLAMLLKFMYELATPD
ncbi:MAG: DUF4145 domain-containing protein [Bdellovibrionales bacterium]